MAEFIEWKKIPRFENEVYEYTEKIDGTNACFYLAEDGSFHCQSRTRIITPEDDNFGFATWCHRNINELRKLHPGYHFGEWWGSGIQRNYGLSEKRFSLFFYRGELPTDIVDRVPVLPVSSPEEAKDWLRRNGSKAVPGWMKPEGAVVYSRLTNQRYKIIIDK